MEPKKKTVLMEFTVLAKAVIFNEQRLQELVPMMGTPDGSVQAVQAVVGAIEQKKPVPPDVAPLLGMNIYMLLVDMAQQITGDQPDEQIVLEVIKMIFVAMKERGGGEGTPGEQAQDQMQPGGEEAPADMRQDQMPRPAGRGMVASQMGV